jgi:CRISPR-associated helicase Cas3
MIEIEILPVAFDQVETDEWLVGRKPYEYQWRAFQLVRQALGSKRTLCLFLVTPTGSGKTLTAYAHSIKTGLPALGVYPTNELLADQERALLPEYAGTGNNRVIRIDSAALDEWQISYEMRRHSDTLEVIMNHKPVLLTNPDILFYIIFGLYPAISGLRERLWSLLGGNYRLFAFDEFHLYNVKQQADVAFFIGALNAINPNVGRVFIFASATPDLEMVELLREKLGLWVEVIEAHPSQSVQARTIAHPVRLILIPADLDRWQGLTALDESFGAIRAFNETHPLARTVAIFDSVAAAIGAARRFGDAFAPGLVGEVHGLSSAAMRREALARKFTVGTSTIEVGVDFKDSFEKDFLVFEARTSSQFLQRFGRIGRHEKGLSIPNQTLALAPAYVCNFFAERTKANGVLARNELRELVEEAYREPQQFRRYLNKHAAVEMIKAANLVAGMFQPDDQPRIRDGLSHVIKNLTGNSPRQAQKKRRIYEESRILTPLLTFRGNGLEAAILDARDEDPGFPAKRYDLLFLLRRGIFEELSKEVFDEELEQLEQERPNWDFEIAREKRFAKLIDPEPEKLLGVYGFFRLVELTHQAGEARRVWFEIDEEDIVGKVGKVALVENLSIKTDPQAPTRLLNRLLRRKQMVAWMIDAHPSGIRLGRSLPPLFSVHELRIIRPGGNFSAQPWSIAFNQDAFFLDSLFWNITMPADAFIL